MILTLIAAIGRNREIGANNALLWDLPKDMQHFRETTKNSAVIMGRKTFESIGRPLPKRTNIVLTRNPASLSDRLGIITASSLLTAKKCAEDQGRPDAFVIGGEEIYRLALPLADRLILTFVDADFPEADSFFPEFDAGQWEEISAHSYSADAEHAYPFRIAVLEKA